MPVPHRHPLRRLRARAAVLTAAAVAVSATAVAVLTAGPALAAPAACTASDAAIYTAPARITAAPGTVLQCRSTTLPRLSSDTKFSAWKVQYVSTDVRGAKVAATGTIIVPTAAWKGSGSRPLVAFAPGTLGSGPQCAFSKQIAGAYQDAYEMGNLDKSLAAGYAVAATDGQGYLTGQVHPYIVGLAAGHAILDGARSAFDLPAAGLSRSTKIGLWGYSEGGATSLWGAQLAASYAPELDIVGVASGGVPGDLRPVAAQLNGGPFAGFLVDAVLGLSTAYPTLPFTSLLNQAGRDAVAKGKTVCLLGTLASFAGAKIESYTTKGYSLDQLYALAAPDGTTWGQVVDAQKLGVGIGRPGSGAKYQIKFPTYQYRGALEEVIATSAEDQTRARYCSAGITTEWSKSFPGEHLTTDALAVDPVVSWLGDRFAGRLTLGNCLFG